LIQFFSFYKLSKFIFWIKFLFFERISSLIEVIWNVRKRSQNFVFFTNYFILSSKCKKQEKVVFWFSFLSISDLYCLRLSQLFELLQFDELYRFLFVILKQNRSIAKARRSIQSLRNKMKRLICSPCEDNNLNWNQQKNKIFIFYKGFQVRRWKGSYAHRVETQIWIKINKEIKYLYSIRVFKWEDEKAHMLTVWRHKFEWKFIKK
jgi:hypothetical protein